MLEAKLQEAGLLKKLLDGAWLLFHCIAELLTRVYVLR